jgi:hypothetical protein
MAGVGDPIVELGQRIRCFLFLVAVVVGGLFTMDVIASPDGLPAAGVSANVRLEPEGALHAGKNRAFVLFVDSLRYETATDPALMPRFVKLRERGTSGRVMSTRDSITLPAIRAAFTGRDRATLFGFVENLWKGNARVPSLFGDLSARGLASSVYSDGTFGQFGADVSRVRSNEGRGANEVDAQSDALKEAYADYRSGKFALVVAHLTHTDHVAHEFGVSHPMYRARYALVDEIIEKLDRAIPADETFVVMGDHGHDARGRHSMGLGVATFAFYRGPGYCAGCDLGTIPITEHRYLLSWALGLPLPRDFRGGGHPQALRAEGELPAAYRSSVPAEASEPASERGGSGERLVASSIMAIYLGTLACVWGMLVRAHGGATWTTWSAFVTVLPLAFPFWFPYSAAGGIAVAAAWTLVVSRRLALSSWRECAAITSSALALYGWGYLLAASRSVVHDLTYGMLLGGWCTLLVLALAATAWRKAPALGWLVVGAPLFLLYPSVYRYGAPAAMAPAWGGWAAVGLAALPREFRGERSWLSAMASAGGLLSFLLPFKAADGLDFQFQNWVAWPADMIPGGWLTFGLIALVILFLRRGMRPRAICGALAIGALVAIVEMRLLPLGRLEPMLGLSLVCVGAVLRKRTDLAGDSAQLARAAMLGGLLIAYHALVRIPAQAYLWADCLFACIVLSAALLRHTRGGTTELVSSVFLRVLGMVVAGWVTLAWGVRWLEWGFLYDWFGAEFVETHVGWFLPLILMRYVIPVWIVRILLGEEPEEGRAESERTSWLVWGAKILSLLLFAYGAWHFEPTTDPRLEAAAQTALATVLAAGLL